MKVWLLLTVSTALLGQTSSYNGLGNSSPYTDTTGIVWAADNGCTSSTQFTVSNTITGTSDPTLYQHGRQSTSAFSCTYSVNNNIFYTVTLKFSNTQNFTVGQRIFNIFINNTLVKSNFDLASPGVGLNTAFDLGFLIPVTNSQIVVNLQPINGGELLNAISITPFSGSNVSIKSALADGIYYVGTLGSDNNDGLSPGSAKATIAGVQTACIANQIANCIIHAEALRSATFTSEIDVGRQAEDLNVTLYLPRATWTFNITDGVSCGIKQFGKTTIISENTPVGNATMILVPASSSTNMQALYCTNPSPPNTGSYINIRGLNVTNTVGATLVRGAFVIQHLFDNSRFENIYAQNNNGVALKIFDTCCGTSIWNSEGFSAHGTGGLPVVIGDSVLGGGVNSGGVQDMGFYSLSAIDPPTGTSAITFADTTGRTGVLTFTNLHVEAPNSTAPGLQLACNVGNVSVVGMSYTNLPGGDTTSLPIDIPTCTNAPYDFFTGILSATTNALTDHGTGLTLGCTTTGFINSCPPYSTGIFNVGADVRLVSGKFQTNGTAGGIGLQFTASGLAIRGTGSSGDSDFIDLGNITFRDSNGLTGGSLTSGGTFRAKVALADQGSICTNGELVLSAGWQSTGSATVTAVVGNGQTCSWTITTGTTTAANPTVTDTLTNALPAATTVCEMNIHGGTHTAAAGEGFQQTTLSATAPIFTFNGTPTAGGTTYFVTRRCGP